MFLPLFNLYRAYGDVFRLSFGPKSFVIVSSPQVAKEVRFKYLSPSQQKNYSRWSCWHILSRDLDCHVLTPAWLTPLAHALLQILLTNAKLYSKGILSEILEFVMGQVITLAWWSASSLSFSVGTCSARNGGGCSGAPGAFLAATSAACSSNALSSGPCLPSSGLTLALSFVFAGPHPG